MRPNGFRARRAATVMTGAAVLTGLLFSTGAYWDTERVANERVAAIAANRGHVGLGSVSFDLPAAQLVSARTNVGEVTAAAHGVAAELRGKLGDARADALLGDYETLARDSAGAEVGTAVTAAVARFQASVDQARAEIAEWDRKEAERIAAEQAAAEAAAAAAAAAAAEAAAQEADWGYDDSDDDGWYAAEVSYASSGTVSSGDTHSDEYLRLKAAFAERVAAKRAAAAAVDTGLTVSAGCSNGAPRE
ncbi:hypothetical protein [Agromyces humi]|uniref:hypothetical protein n=1 Tax=Agromyces humi TaxID=1766800 RepID=UPI00135A9DE3|nr:hypothetical protein [Agromyces humi]